MPFAANRDAEYHWRTRYRLPQGTEDRPQGPASPATPEFAFRKPPRGRGNFLRRMFSRHLCRGKVIPVGRVDLRDFVIRRYPLITSAVMVRRACLDAVGGFDTAIAVGEDFDLWARVLHRFPQAYIAEPLTDYRVHGGGATANRLRNRLSKVQVLEKLQNDPAFEGLSRDPVFVAHLHRQYQGAARLLAANGRHGEADALYRKALALDIPWHTRLAARLRRLRHG